jgi:hypothetical protein
MVAATGGAGESARRRRVIDDVLVEALGRGLSYTAAAAIAGVSAKTPYRRMQDPAFRTRVEQHAEDNMRQVVGGLGALSVDALEVLGRRMRDDDHPAEQLRAAGLVLAQLLRFRQIAEFERRLRDIEAQLSLHPATRANDRDERS